MATYMEWKKVLAERSIEKVLQTISHILEEADKHLDHEDLDMLKDCWKIICMADK